MLVLNQLVVAHPGDLIRSVAKNAPVCRRPWVLFRVNFFELECVRFGPWVRGSRSVGPAAHGSRSGPLGLWGSGRPYVSPTDFPRILPTQNTSHLIRKSRRPAFQLTKPHEHGSARQSRRDCWPNCFKNQIIRVGEHFRTLGESARQVGDTWPSTSMLVTRQSRSW